MGELKPTCMSLQLVDKSVKFLSGIIDDILVKVEKFIFPVDFMILNMDEDIEVPLILKSPFFTTARAIIFIGDGKLTLQVGNEELVVRF